jgi:hypothetical protein
MNTGNRRRNKAQQPPPPESEQISSEDGWIDGSITELDPKNDFDLDDVKQLIAAAKAELSKDRTNLEVVQQLINEALSASPQTSHRRKPGPKANWRFVAAGEAYNFRREHGRMPSFKELADRCEDKLDQPLNETNTYKLLTHLGVAD